MTEDHMSNGWKSINAEMLNDTARDAFDEYVQMQQVAKTSRAKLERIMREVYKAPEGKCLEFAYQYGFAMRIVQDTGQARKQVVKAQSLDAWLADQSGNGHAS
jgi:hypothetical protein